MNHNMKISDGKIATMKKVCLDYFHTKDIDKVKSQRKAEVFLECNPESIYMLILRLEDSERNNG